MSASIARAGGSPSAAATAARRGSPQQEGRRATADASNTVCEMTIGVPEPLHPSPSAADVEALAAVLRHLGPAAFLSAAVNLVRRHTPHAAAEVTDLAPTNAADAVARRHVDAEEAKRAAAAEAEEECVFVKARADAEEMSGKEAEKGLEKMQFEVPSQEVEATEGSEGNGKSVGGPRNPARREEPGWSNFEIAAR